jgi:DNA helicase-2/ATP-dependent DNA helicase PcrA
MSLNDFINNPKTLIVAPAGYGKTHTLANCISLYPNSGKQLVLTHTHAGIASIKEKIKAFNIPPSKYHIETITGFIQKYVLAFYCGNDLPQQDAPNYYEKLVEKARDIFKTKSVKRIIATSFNGLFVDEYQDCTISQHNIIAELSTVLPTHILGDPLQGIFGFNEPLISFETHLSEFENLPPLTTPWRWNRQNRHDLGNDLDLIRGKLIAGENISFSSFPSVETVICDENDWFKPRTSYRDKIESLLTENSLLFLHPNITSIHPRVKMIKQFQNRFSLLESIDDKQFYEYSRIIDGFVFDTTLILQIKKLAYKLFNKTGLDNWFNERGFKRKTNDVDRSKVIRIQALIEEYQNLHSQANLSKILKAIKNLSGVKNYRRELFSSLCKALELSKTDNISVFEAMKFHRNKIRRMGRKVIGKNIGTTLLTKGLEFDTVAILNAHQIRDPKHLYVALTRASKRLVVFTQNDNTQF